MISLAKAQIDRLLFYAWLLLMGLIFLLSGTMS
jgi:hypothetical protein